MLGKPPLIKMPVEQIIGDVPLVLPLTTMDAVEHRVLESDLQDYDTNKFPLWRDEFEHELATQGGLLGLRCGVNSAMPLPPPAQTPAYAGGMSGFGADMTPVPQKVSIAAPPPLEQSTVIGIVGAATVLIIGSVALWAIFKGKRS